MPGINPIKASEIAINLAKKGVKEASEVAKETKPAELEHVPAETLRAYIGLGFKKAAAEEVKAGDISISDKLSEVDKLVSKKSYVTPRLRDNTTYFPKFLEESFADYRNHINTLEVSLTEGLKGGHNASLYKTLTDTIRETVSSVQKRSVGRIKRALNENNVNAENVLNISSKDKELLFDIKTADGQILKGVMKSDGSVAVKNSADETVANIKASKDLSKGVYKEIYDIKRGRSLVNSVNRQIQTPIPIQSVEMEGDSIILGFGDVNNLRLPKRVSEHSDETVFGIIDAKDLKFKLTPEVVDNGLSIYNQEYLYRYVENGRLLECNATNYPPKAIIDETTLNKVSDFIERNSESRSHILYKIPNSSESKSAYILRYENNYYVIACSKKAEGDKIVSLYPATTSYLESKNCVLADVPDLTQYIEMAA